MLIVYLTYLIMKLIPWSFLNNQRSNIKFAIEKEVDKKLLFLDVLMTITTRLVLVSLENTFSGLLSNNDTSFASLSCKKGLIKIK